MFTKKDKARKNWRSQKRALRKARNKRERTIRRLSGNGLTSEERVRLQNALTRMNVKIATLELRVDDRKPTQEEGSP